MKSKIEATNEAKWTLSQMQNPKRWRISVWNNCGWHYCLEHKPSDALLTVWPGYCGERVFHAMLSLNMPRVGDCEWSDHYRSDDPNKAVTHVLRRAKAVMLRKLANFNKVAGRIAK